MNGRMTRQYPKPMTKTIRVHVSQRLNRSAKTTRPTAMKPNRSGFAAGRSRRLWPAGDCRVDVRAEKEDLEDVSSVVIERFAHLEAARPQRPEETQRVEREARASSHQRLSRHRGSATGRRRQSSPVRSARARRFPVTIVSSKDARLSAIQTSIRGSGALNARWRTARYNSTTAVKNMCGLMDRPACTSSPVHTRRGPSRESPRVCRTRSRRAATRIRENAALTMRRRVSSAGEPVVHGAADRTSAADDRDAGIQASRFPEAAKARGARRRACL